MGIHTGQGVWVQETKLTASDAVGPYVYQGVSVGISSDGNTIIPGGSQDNGGTGAAWLFKRINGLWMRQGKKLVGTGVTPWGGIPRPRRRNIR